MGYENEEFSTQGEDSDAPVSRPKMPTITPMQAASRLLTRLSEIRVCDWNLFWKSTHFRVPKNHMEAIIRRVILNAVYFQGNYAVMMLLAILFVCVSRPIFGFMLLCYLGNLLYMYSYGANLQHGSSLKKVLTTVFALILVYVGGSSLWSAIVICSSFVAGHAVCRIPPSPKFPSNGIKSLWMCEESVIGKIMGMEKTFDIEDPECHEGLVNQFRKEPSKRV